MDHAIAARGLNQVAHSFQESHSEVSDECSAMTLLHADYISNPLVFAATHR